ncbi:MAG: hypothetical protein HC822_14890 [Oscillochloris sp.]|nr:hypothetical protein [Oscillochloris sp.]
MSGYLVGADFARPVAREFGFRGLIVSDALDMGAIADRYGAPQAAVLAKQAGIDLLIPMGDPVNQAATAGALLAALESGRLQVADFQATARRMDALRHTYELDRPTSPPPPISSAQTQAALDLACTCLTIDDEPGLLPLVPATDLLVIDCLQPRFNNVEEAVARADLLRGMVLETFPGVRYTALLPADEPAWAAALAEAHAAAVTVLITRNAVFVERQARLACDLRAATDRLIHLAVRSSADAALTPGATHVLTYGDQPLGLWAAVERLAGVGRSQ